MCKFSIHPLGLLGLILLAACTPSAPSAAPHIVNVYASQAAGPWLADLYRCPSSAVIRLTDAQSADLALRLGEAPDPAAPAFQIGTDDVLVVVHPQVGIGSLTVDQVRQLYLGQVVDWKDLGGQDLPVQVWVYSEAEDLQQYFEKAVLDGRPVTSLARLASGVEDMSTEVGANPGSIGFVLHRSLTGGLKPAFTVGSVPVLAITSSQPQGAVRDLIACLQK